MDLIIALPKTKNNFDAILNVGDRLTKMVHFIPTNVIAPELTECSSTTSSDCTAYLPPSSLIVTKVYKHLRENTLFHLKHHLTTFHRLPS